MADRLYVCAYPNCLHHGEKVSSLDSVVISKKHYHWDCAAMRQEITDIRNFYIDKIDGDAKLAVLSKVLNDLIFKYKLNIDYIKFSIQYYAEYGIKIKSPFSLLYLRDNAMMNDKWEKNKRR